MRASFATLVASIALAAAGGYGLHAYADGVYGIDRAVVRLLDQNQIRYREATREDAPR